MVNMATGFKQEDHQMPDAALRRSLRGASKHRLYRSFDRIWRVWHQNTDFCGKAVFLGSFVMVVFFVFLAAV
jgi:hypothetical protein